MGKIHTRVKRKWGLSTHLRHYRFFHPGPKKKKEQTQPKPTYNQIPAYRTAPG